MTQTIPALKIAEAFIAEELAVRQRSYEPHPTDNETQDIADATEALKAVQGAINTIAIHKSPTGWNVQYGGPHASPVQMLFGTTVLPSAFTSAAAPETVLSFVRDRHPGCYVELADTKWQRLCR
jgi:hypothetical protein